MTVLNPDEENSPLGDLIRFPHHRANQPVNNGATAPDLTEPVPDDSTTTADETPGTELAPDTERAPERSELGRVPPALRGAAARSWEVTREGARYAAPYVGAAARQARRHGAIVGKGLEQRRQQRRADRGQADLKAARRQALEKGDYASAREISQQMSTVRKASVEAATDQLELIWEITKKAAIAVTALVGVVIVTGAINAIGHWLGPWDALDVLYLLGMIVTGAVGTLRLLVEHWLAAASTVLGLVTAVWLSRRWRDGHQLGEAVLPVELRRGDAVAGVDFDESALVTALSNIGLPALKQAVKEGWPNRESDRAWVQFPVLDGPGMTAKLRLPQGAPVEKVKKAKTTLAHNLGCLPAELWIEKDEHDPSVLDLFRLNPGELRKPAPQYPLLDGGQADYFAGFPVGVGPKREPITGTVFERNYVISGIMGSGKSTLVLSLLAGAVLDPLLDIDVFVFAENADYDPFKPCFNRFVMGDTEDNVSACQDHIAGLHADLARRGQLLQKHGVTKVNREVAAKEPGLRPRLVVIDECQSYFRRDDPQDRREVINGMVRFFSAARKYGITLCFVTPIPSDQSLPRDLVSVTSNRACFAIGDKTRNNVVLGDKAHENGISALGLKPADDEQLNDVGTSVTVGFTTVDGTTLKSYYLPRDQQEAVAQRGLELRGEASQPAEQQDRDLLADVAHVLGRDDTAKAKTVVHRLHELAPGYEPYSALTAESLAEHLDSDHAVPVRKKDGYLTVRAQRVQAALADRTETTPTDEP